MDEEQLESTPVHRSALRPFLIFGAERDLALVSVLMCVTVGFSALFGKSFWNLIIAVVMWPVLISALRMLAAHDPMLSLVYRRHIRLQSYYSAHSRPFRKQ